MSNIGEILQQRSGVINTNTSDSGSKNTNTNTRTLIEVQRIAHELEDKLGKQVPSRLDYYYKVVWKLPDYVIYNALEAELANRLKGKPAHRLFSWLTTEAMKKAQA